MNEGGYIYLKEEGPEEGHSFEVSALTKARWKIASIHSLKEICFSSFKVQKQRNPEVV